MPRRIEQSTWDVWRRITKNLVYAKFPEKDDENDYEGEMAVPVAAREDAQLVCSSVSGTDRHKILLDLDMPAALIPSTTEGHFHLYIDHEVSWSDYLRLLAILAELGVIEAGYYSATLDRECTRLRMPWVDKQ